MGLKNAYRRIYVACLASYGSGILHGAWIDCDGQDADGLQSDVNAMLRASPCPNVMVECPDCEAETRADCDTCKGKGQVASAEEFAIHDSEGFGDCLEEYTSLADVAELAERLDEHGDAWCVYSSHVGAQHATVENFREVYCGEYASEKAFAEQYVDDGLFGKIPDELTNYLDYDAIARDLFINGFYFDDGHVFRRD